MPPHYHLVALSCGGHSRPGQRMDGPSYQYIFTDYDGRSIRPPRTLYRHHGGNVVGGGGGVVDATRLGAKIRKTRNLITRVFTISSSLLVRARCLMPLVFRRVFVRKTLLLFRPLTEDHSTDLQDKTVRDSPSRVSICYY